MAWDNLNLDIDDESIKHRKEADQSKYRERAKAYHACFRTDAGQKVLQDLTSMFIMNNSTSLTATNIEYEAGYHAGEAGAIKYIMTLIQKAEVL